MREVEKMFPQTITVLIFKMCICYVKCCCVRCSPTFLVMVLPAAADSESGDGVVTCKAMVTLVLTTVLYIQRVMIVVR